MEDSKKGILKEIIGILSIVGSLSENERDLRRLILMTGWELDELAGFNLSDLSNTLAPLSGDLQQLLIYIDQPPDSFAEIGDAFDKAKSAFDRLAQLKEVLQSVDLEGPAKDTLLAFGKDLLNILIVLYIHTKYPIAFHFLYLLTLIDFDETDLRPVSRADGKVIRHMCLMPKLKLSRVKDVFSKPEVYFKQYYFPNGLQTDTHALIAAHKLFPRFGHILNQLGINTQMGFNTKSGMDLGVESNELAKGMFTAFFEPNYENINFAVTLALSPASRANLGLVVIPFGSLSFSKIFQSWQFNFNLTAGTEGFAVGPEGATILVGVDSTQIELNLQITKLPEEGQSAFLLGGRSGSRLEIGELIFDTGLSIKEASYEIDLLLQANKGMFVIMPGDGDGFLAKILPRDGIQLDFDFGLGWSSRSGLYFKGHAGLEAEYAFHQSFLGILKLQSLRLKLYLSESGLVFITDSTLEVKLGPVTGIVHELGIQTEVSFVSEGGNAGIANNKIAFKPPSGIGLSIDAGGIKGGGFLKFDDDNKEYFGALELEFKDMFSMKALGIITTRMPDGSDGFSLLIIITAEFTPIQLGLGFTLNGVGGLIGINRTVRIEVLREGIKTNTLKSILFPENIIANVDRIVSDIKQVFPPANDHFIFCPMGKLGWGTPTLLTIELGILIEIPANGFVILGVLKALLPEEDNALLKLQVNFLGEIDFENKSISFYASLYDSRLLVYTLTGDLAFRLSWGDPSLFLLSVGGFHPAFHDAPADLRRMSRFTISLLSGENPCITVQGYFAITSNTAQFGAKAELYAAKGSFNIYGFIGFDVLFQFDPFMFITDFGAGVALRRNTSVIMSIRVSGELSGPTPWHVQGKASISFFFFSISVPFNHTWGEDRDEPLIEKADVLALLTKEVNNSFNWKADIPAYNNLHVSVKNIELPADESENVIIHPFGIITFSERLVPLGVTIDKFGDQTPKDANLFKIKTTDTELTTENVNEQFAPANFFNKTDSEKLSSPSFEHFPAGFKIVGSSALQAPTPLTKGVNYELTYLSGKQSKGSEKYNFFRSFFKANLKGGAVAKSPLSFAKNRISVNAPEAVTVQSDQFAIANVSDMRLHDSGLVAGSYAEAIKIYNDLITKQPELKEQVQVVSQYEVNLN